MIIGLEKSQKMEKSNKHHQISTLVRKLDINITGEGRLDKIQEMIGRKKKEFKTDAE